MERNLSSGSAASAWGGIKSMVGLKNRTGGNRATKMSNTQYTDHEFADKLNSFYLRFDAHDFSIEQSNIKESVITEERVLIDKESVFKSLRSNKTRKSPGPDNISGHVLKYCAVT